MQYISYLSTLVTFVFAIAVFRRYLLRHGPYLLIWTIGLLWFGLGTLSEIILSLTFSGLVLKLWYLCGAMLTTAWLGQGTLHLLVRWRGVAWTLTGLLVAVSVLAAVLVLHAPLTPVTSAYRVSQPISSQYQDILTRSGLIIVLTVLLNIYGTLTLVGGAIYSAYIFWRKRVLFNRMIGNILIAAGAFAPAMGGSFIRIGLADWLYLTELVGVILMYIGFLQATTIPAVEAAPTISH
ncbi:MAG: hypothetical protein Q8N46_02760 [Anaerolineales bacterium]|nr:hypothetical protein [Anaerolineales bacterium]